MSERKLKIDEDAFYNEALELVKERLSNASEEDISAISQIAVSILKKIPDRQPLPGDEL